MDILENTGLGGSLGKTIGGGNFNPKKYIFIKKIINTKYALFFFIQC